MLTLLSFIINKKGAIFNVKGAIYWNVINVAQKD